MRLRAVIMLLIFSMLFSLGGCTKPGDAKKETARSKNKIVSSSAEKPLADQTVSKPKEDKLAANDTDKVGDRAANNSALIPDAENKAAVKKTTEVSAPQAVTQARICINGTGVKASQEFSLQELKQMTDITVSARYFSRGAAKPGWNKTASTDFAGVLLYELLAEQVGLSDTAKQVKIIAEDGYTQVFSLNDLQASYIDENDSSKKLRMIIAWSQDGEAYNPQKGAPYRLVMGQAFAGEYNRLKWVERVKSIVVE